MWMPSNALQLQIKPAVKISGRAQERSSLSFLWNKYTFDHFHWHKYRPIEKGAERTVRDDLSLYPKARFARSEPFVVTGESVAP